MSYPKQLERFREWAKRMEANATVDVPKAGKPFSLAARRKGRSSSRRPRKLKRKKSNASQES